MTMQAEILEASVQLTSAASGTTVDLDAVRIDIDDRVGQTDDTCSVTLDEIFLDVARGDELTIRLNNGRERVFPVLGGSRTHNPDETVIKCRRHIDPVAAAQTIRTLIRGSSGSDLGGLSDEYFARLQDDLTNGGYRNELAQFIDEEGQSSKTLSDWRSFLDAVAMEITAELQIVPFNYVRGRVSLPDNVLEGGLRVDESDYALLPSLVSRSDGDVIVMVRYVKEDGMTALSVSDVKGDGTPRPARGEVGFRIVLARTDAPSRAAVRVWTAAEYERLFKRSASMFFTCAGNDELQPLNMIDLGADHPESSRWRYWRVNSVTHGFDLENKGWDTAVSCTPAREPAYLMD